MWSWELCVSVLLGGIVLEGHRRATTSAVCVCNVPWAVRTAGEPSSAFLSLFLQGDSGPRTSRNGGGRNIWEITSSDKSLVPVSDVRSANRPVSWEHAPDRIMCARYVCNWKKAREKRIPDQDFAARGPRMTVTATWWRGAWCGAESLSW